MTPQRKYYLKNKDRIKTQNREYMREWQRANPELVRERARKFYEQNKERLAAEARVRYATDPTYQVEYRQENREVCNARTRDWQKRNRHIVTATGAKYRATRLKATSSWLTSEDKAAIESFYAEAARLTIMTGVKFEVDHIIPLQGKNVCGLHVPSNLAILAKYENTAKGNKYE